MRFFKKKEKPSPFEPVKTALLKELGENSQPYTFNYDLSYTNQKVLGVCALFEKKLYLKEKDNPETRVIDLESINEVYFVNNWGCVSVEAKTEKGEIEICRAEMRLSNQIRAAVKEIENALKENSNEGEKEIKPKTKENRPENKKGKNTSKAKLFALLVPYAKPQMKLLLLAALCLVVVSAANLVLPFFNKTIVDDYLTADPFPTDKSGFFWLIGGMALIGLFAALINALRRYFVTFASKNILISFVRTYMPRFKAFRFPPLTSKARASL